MIDDVNRKNEDLKVLLVENQLLKERTLEQETQIAKLKHELEGNELWLPTWLIL